jgi:DNA relaxase NicK
LSSYGLIYNIKLTRVDFAIDYINTDYPIKPIKFIPLDHRFDPNVTQTGKQNYKSSQYLTASYFEINVYDKLKERISRGYWVNPSIRSWTRFELRITGDFFKRYLDVCFDDYSAKALKYTILSAFKSKSDVLFQLKDKRYRQSLSDILSGYVSDRNLFPLIKRKLTNLEKFYNRNKYLIALISELYSDELSELKNNPYYARKLKEYCS